MFPYITKNKWVSHNGSYGLEKKHKGYVDQVT